MFNLDKSIFFLSNCLSNKNCYLVNGFIFLINNNRLNLNNSHNNLRLNWTVDETQIINKIKNSIITLKLEKNKIKMDWIIDTINKSVIKIKGKEFKKWVSRIPIVFLLDHWDISIIMSINKINHRIIKQADNFLTVILIIH